MKAVLEFNLPDDDKEHKRAIHSLDLALALCTIEEYLRGVDKYNKGDDIEKIRETFYEILADHNIVLDDLIE